jgi:hypothetical protein
VGGWTAFRNAVLRNRWPWLALAGAAWLATLLLVGAASRRDVPDDCKSIGFREAADSAAALYYAGLYPALVAVSATLLGAIFCRSFRRVFVVICACSVLLVAFCFLAGLTTMISPCDLD